MATEYYLISPFAYNGGAPISGALLTTDSGTAAAPAVGIGPSSNYGLYVDSVHTALGFTVAGTEVGYISASGEFAGVGAFVATQNGTAANPTFALGLSSNNGMYYDSTNTALGFSLAGTEGGWLGQTGFGTAYRYVSTSNGTAAAPVFGLGASSNSGMYWDSGLGGLGWSISGTEAMKLISNELIVNGSNSVLALNSAVNTTGAQFTCTGVGTANFGSSSSANGTLSMATLIAGTVEGTGNGFILNGGTAYYLGSSTSTPSLAILAGFSNAAALNDGTNGQGYGSLVKSELYIPVTTSNPISVNRAGSIISNAGSSGTVTYTLPTPAAGTTGMTLTFYCAVANSLVIQAQSGAAIYNGTTLGTAGHTLTSIVPGSTVKLVWDGTNWFDHAMVGTWVAV